MSGEVLAAVQTEKPTLPRCEPVLHCSDCIYWQIKTIGFACCNGESDHYGHLLEHFHPFCEQGIKRER